MISLKKNEPISYNHPKPAGYKSTDELIMECRKGIYNEYGVDYFRGLTVELVARLAESEAKLKMYETFVFEK